MSVAAEISWTQYSKTELDPLFENAPFALARCQHQGNITACNTFFERMVGSESGSDRQPHFLDIILPEDRAGVERLLGELFERHRDSFQIDSQMVGEKFRSVRWTAWLVAGANGIADYVML